MSKETGEAAKARKDGFQIPIDEEAAGKMLDAIYEKALGGVPKVSRSVDEMCEDYLSKAKSPDQAAKALAKWQVMKCSTSGFVAGLGGLITLPVAIPANVGSVMYVQMRMIACIAKMAGYDIKSDQVQTMVYMCLTGTTLADLTKIAGIKFGTKSLEVAIKKIPGAALVKINQKVGFRFLTKFGQKGIVNLGKMVPLLGGAIGGGVDGVSTMLIARSAIQMFMNGGNPEDAMPTEDEILEVESIEVEEEGGLI
ncbi:hypothetical protein [Paratractidigestivibacter faecalis]|uniref:hypothetical protein n=1 Tax=Paratractidigestivibacter faecalis TaxID=2292441 RepID=UPI003AB3555E